MLCRSVQTELMRRAGCRKVYEFLVLGMRNEIEDRVETRRGIEEVKYRYYCLK